MSFEAPVIIARPFNTYGPRQSARAVVPTIITQLLAGRSQIKLGSLHPTRDLNYVIDTCDGMIALMECDEALGKTLNIGSGRDVSIGDLANMLKDIVGSDAEIVTESERIRPDKSEVERLVCDASRLTELTRWQPRVSLEDGLAKTVEWFRDDRNRREYKWEIYNV